MKKIILTEAQLKRLIGLNEEVGEHVSDFNQMLQDEGLSTYFSSGIGMYKPYILIDEDVLDEIRNNEELVDYMTLNHLKVFYSQFQDGEYKIEESEGEAISNDPFEAIQVSQINNNRVYTDERERPALETARNDMRALRAQGNSGRHFNYFDYGYGDH